jgi:hypothetical protein
MVDTLPVERPIGLSVVIPTYKRVQPTLRAIESVRSQSPHEVEIVVVDDGSPQDPLGLLPVRNACGIAVRGFRLAHNSGHIAFLDSDDEFTASKMDVLLALIRSQEIDLVFHAVDGMPRYHKLAAMWDTWLRALLPFRWLCVLYNPVITPSLVIRRQHRLGCIGLRHCEDWAFLLRYVTTQTRVVYLHQELALVHRQVGTAGGASAAIWSMRKGEFKARSMLLRNSSGPSDFVRWCLGTGMGAIRVLADLLRGRYRRQASVE